MGYDILFLGKLFPKEKEAEIKGKMKSGMQDAANALQWNIINGLDANNCGRIRILDQLPVDSYPRGYTDKIIEEYVFQHASQYRSDDKVVRCSNLMIVKQFANLGPFKVEARRWAIDENDEKKVLVLYTASVLFLQIAKYIKRVNEKIETCCIIADLPEFSSARTFHGIRKVYNDYQAKKAAGLYQYIDKFVLLTDQMADRLRLKVPYIVMEGIAPEQEPFEDIPLPYELEGKQYILYTGTLSYEFGIGTLLEAFEKNKDENLKLVICGFGEAEEAILKSRDKRIVYLGKVDRMLALALQRGATILVNPRQNNNEFTKYSFPSKTMEYLASGTPVVAYRLDGIPPEYAPFLHSPANNTPQALAEEIQRLLALPQEERHAWGQAAREYVLTNKGAAAQTKRILDLLG